MKKLLIILLMCFASSLALISLARAAEMPDYVYLFDAGKPDISNWQNLFYGDVPAGADIRIKAKPDGGSLAVIEGNSDKENFGCVYQYVSVDLDKYPFFEVDVSAVSKFWYIVILNENLEGKEEDSEGNKFVRVQPDIGKIGKFSYNLKNILDLSGDQTLCLKVGVASGERHISNRGHAVSFNYIRLAKEKKQL